MNETTPVPARAGFGSSHRAPAFRAWLAAIPTDTLQSLDAARANGTALILVGSVLVAACGLYLLRLDAFQIGTWGDDAHYIVTARAIAAGKGYALASFPDAPAAITYPPGYPLVLASLAAAKPDSLSLFMAPSVLVTLVSLLLWYLLLRRRLPPLPALLILCAVVTNSQIVQFATMVMSEALFGCLLALLFLLLDVDLRKAGDLRFRSVVITLVLIALYFTRAIGIVFLPATLSYLVLARRFRSAMLVLGLFLIPFSLWSYRNITVSDGGLLALLSPGYEQHLDQEIAQASEEGVSRFRLMTMNVQYYTSQLIPEALSLDTTGPRIASFLDSAGLVWLQSAIGVLLGGLLILGFLHRIRDRPTLAEISVIFYAGALLLWPGPVTRLLHPVIPLIYLFLFDGVRASLGRMPRLPAIATTRIAAMLLGALVVLNLVRAVQGITDPVRNRITDISVGSQWLAEHSPIDSVVMADVPISRHLYSQRRMVDLPARRRAAASDYVETVRRSGAEYVLVAPPLQTPSTTDLSPAAARMDAALATRPEEFAIVFEDPSENVRIYRLRSAAFE